MDDEIIYQGADDREYTFTVDDFHPPSYRDYETGEICLVNICTREDADGKVEEITTRQAFADIAAAMGPAATPAAIEDEVLSQAFDTMCERLADEYESRYD